MDRFPAIRSSRSLRIKAKFLIPCKRESKGTETRTALTSNPARRSQATPDNNSQHNCAKQPRLSTALYDKMKLSNG